MGDAIYLSKKLESRKPLMEYQPCFLSYLFNGARIEFFADHLTFVLPLTRDKYKMTFDYHDREVPFQIVLLERGRPDGSERP